MSVLQHDQSATALNQAYLYGDAVFGTQSRFKDGQFRSTAEGIIETLTVYVWPKNVDNDHKLAVIAYFTAYGCSESESPSAWACWTYSYLCLCFPEFRRSMEEKSSREYKFVPLSLMYIESIAETARFAVEEMDSDNGQAYEAVARKIPILPELPEIATDGTGFPPDLAACQTVEVAYGYCGLVFFLAGKKINDKNSITITEKRPQNLIDTYGISDSGSFVLNGEGRMSSTAHRMVTLAWVKYAKARLALITEVATFGAGHTLPQRVVYTVTKMLENSGMQQANFIHRFLQAYPQSATYTCIRPSLNAYASSIREVASNPPYIQPYYKLIYGENTRAFHRTAILPLASCALTYEKNTSTSLNNFTLGDGAAAAVAMFDSEARSKGHPTIVNVSHLQVEETE
nr:hypothetical protein [Plasmopara viticola lesion associated mononegaambi virus 7]